METRHVSLPEASRDGSGGVAATVPERRRDGRGVSVVGEGQFLRASAAVAEKKTFPARTVAATFRNRHGDASGTVT